MEELASIVLGCAFGGVARFWLSGVVGRRFGETFPWGTMAVNVTGAFCIGLVASLSASGPPFAAFWSLAVVGFLGSYTTVSSFSLQTLALLREREGGRALLNLALSLALCLSAVTAGLTAGARLFGEG